MIHMSIAATAMILVGAAIRFLAMNRLPKRTFVVIWVLVALRLLLPFSLPDTFNVWNLFVGGEDASEVRYLFIPKWEQASTQGIGLVEVISYIWIAGIIIGALHFIITHYKFRKAISDSLPIENGFVSNWLNEHKIFRSIQIRQSYKISSPLTYGILHPVILLPKAMDWQDETQLKYIFSHEYVHIRRFDYGKKILFATALCIHWFNPFVWLMYRLSNRDIELSCDEAVLKIFGEKSKASYALALIHMAEKQKQYSALYNHFSNNMMEERIKVMINMKKTTIFGAILAVIFVAGAMTLIPSSADIYATPFIMDNIEHLTALESDGRTLNFMRNEEWLVQAFDDTDVSATISQELQELIENAFTDLEDGGSVIVREDENGYIVTTTTEPTYFQTGPNAWVSNSEFNDSMVFTVGR